MILGDVAKAAQTLLELGVKSRSVRFAKRLFFLVFLHVGRGEREAPYLPIWET